MSANIPHLTDRDLLGAIDGELTSGRQRAVDAHLAGCETCSARRSRIEAAASATVEAFDSHVRRSADLGDARERLRTRMIVERGRNSQPLSWRSAAPVWMGGLAACVMFALVIGGRAPDHQTRAIAGTTPSAVEHDALPNARLTPGATWNVGVGELCSSTVREQRPIQADVRSEVVRAYGMEGLAADEYELDYLITPELGGAPDARNLWPQRYGSRVWNAYVKDQLERLLPMMVCRGEIDLATAQRDMAEDWIGAYKRHFKTDHPLELRVGLASPEKDEMVYPVWRPEGGPALQLVALSARQ